MKPGTKTGRDYRRRHMYKVPHVNGQFLDVVNFNAAKNGPLWTASYRVDLDFGCPTILLGQ